MTSGIHKHPFAPGPAITHDQLLAYVEERADPREQFEVEFAMEHDALLADAIEGLKLSGSIDGLKELEEHRPGSSFNPWNWFFPIVFLIALFFVPIAMDQRNENADPIVEEQIGLIEDAIPFQVETKEQIQYDTEIHSEDDIEQIAPTSSMIDRNGTIELLRPIKIDLEPIVPREGRTLKIARRQPSGLQLYYLHDLKLLHPKELYPFDPMVELANGTLTADRSDRSTKELKILVPLDQNYLEYMDRALAAYHADPHRCIEDLEYLLDQYPDDLNALFYAGMCHLRIGSFRSAEFLLSRVLSHRFDVFDEEAEFHHAHALEGNGDRKAAQKGFTRIAQAGGFYSERAREEIRSE